MGKILCVDPGSNLGYAIFNEGNKIPITAGNLYPGSRCFTWEDRCFEVCRQLDAKLNSFCIDNGICGLEVAVIEWPSVMLGSAEGGAAAGKKDLMKLGAAVGMIILTCKPRTKRFEFPTVAEWKGQLPKNIVNERIEAICGKLPYSNHALDACGLGLWYMGFLK